MSRIIPRRLLAQSPLSLITESTHTTQLPLRCIRSLSYTPTRPANLDALSSLDRLAPSSAESTSDLARIIGANQSDRARRNPYYNPNASSIGGAFNPESLSGSYDNDGPDPFKLSVFATKHNTHINIMGPDWTADIDPKTGKQPLKVFISMSAGNIGFKKSQRKHYDAAFQLAGYVFGRMKERGITDRVEKLEVQLRGFGSGREAVTKALLGSEGRFLRDKVRKVSDATRLKFGGTRSQKPRRLG
ncbi:hypothetical protein BJ878DRAFT_106941 [Calycina marina]|uniref:Uncharacterized protein n=1 Tax=Calycina marina TaxID=1763456 RepID=A0A9P8CI59_9HELO|nr:hypothetical protein BJ878DRAFT_106941 [Calycina marina]